MAKNIQPLPVSSGGPVVTVVITEAVSLTVSIVGDNLTDTCQLYFEFDDANGQPVPGMHGYTSITGADYTSWTGDNSYPYTYIATMYGATLTS